MVDFKSIESLVKTLSNSSISYLEIEDGEFKIKLSKNSMEKEDLIERTPNVRAEAVVGHEKKEEPQVIGAIQELEKAPEEKFYYIKSPMVGTFYTAPSENGEPYVKVGDRIKKGQEICIVEAMKLMNEIESEVEGNIVEIMVKNGDIVEFGEELFKVKL